MISEFFTSWICFWTRYLHYKKASALNLWKFSPIFKRENFEWVGKVCEAENWGYVKASYRWSKKSIAIRGKSTMTVIKLCQEQLKSSKKFWAGKLRAKKFDYKILLGSTYRLFLKDLNLLLKLLYLHSFKMPFKD